jgi:hypothetical protein
MAVLSSPIASSLYTRRLPGRRARTGCVVAFGDERASGGVAGMTRPCWGEAGRRFLRGADPPLAAMGFA